MNVGLFLKEISYPAIFALIAGTAMYFFKMQFVYQPPILLCGFGFVVGGIAYLAPWFSHANSKKRITQIVEMILSVKNKKLKK